MSNSMSREIVVYTREGCSSCVSLKQSLNAKQIIFNERQIGTDLTLEDFKVQFPGAVMLPVMTCGSNVYLGPMQCNEAVKQYGYDLGKELLTE